MYAYRLCRPICREQPIDDLHSEFFLDFGIGYYFVLGSLQ